MNTYIERALVFGLLLSASVGSVEATEQVPHLDDRGQADFANYQSAAEHRAFAIAPGGVWSWQADMPSAEIALKSALEDCQRYTEQRCVPYAVDDLIVFDATAWPTSWGPYLTAEQAAKAPMGIRRGQRFPDIVIESPAGARGKLSDLRGKVVVLHFWGSWCSPCQREMPDLQLLHDNLDTVSDIAFVLLPVREPLDSSKQWAARRGITLPIFYGGETIVQNEAFLLADGRKLSDRQLARVFPTSYILDKHGVVVFSRIGPVARWQELAAFLQDAAAKSGQ